MVSGRAAAGILAMTGSTVAVGLEADVVAAVGVGELVTAELDEGVVTAGPGSLPVHAPRTASATGTTAYARSGRCRCGRAAAVIGVPCRSSIIVRLRRLRCVVYPLFHDGNLRRSCRTCTPSPVRHPQAPRVHRAGVLG